MSQFKKYLEIIQENTSSNSSLELIIENFQILLEDAFQNIKGSDRSDDYFTLHEIVSGSLKKLKMPHGELLDPRFWRNLSGKQKIVFKLTPEKLDEPIRITTVSITPEDWKGIDEVKREDDYVFPENSKSLINIYEIDKDDKIKKDETKPLKDVHLNYINHQIKEDDSKFYLKRKVK